MTKGVLMILGAASAVLVGSGGAVAQSSGMGQAMAADGGEPTAVNIRWLSGPQEAEMDRLYPASAIALKVEGEVTMECRVVDGGGLSRCNIKFEQPAGFGFGAATLSLASRYRVALRTPEGVSTVGQAVMLHIYWELPRSG